ncbi:MAG: polyprenyl synthetase family protein [Agarilytica sp.]
MNNALSDFIAQYQARVEQALDQHSSQLSAHNTPLVDAIRYSLLDGGKRIRPLLCYAAALAVQDVNPITDEYACALECMHVYSLIHDDLPAMDDDALRRGKPTSHIAFDEATAILAGDALQCFAFDIIANGSALDQQKVLAIQALSHASGPSGMVLGQAIDLAAVDKALTLEQLENMHQHKTGALILASITLGAISAQASAEERNALTDYAKALGLAFQVQDDILDVVSDTKTLGKTQGADQDRNKPTYVSLLGLDAAKAKAQSLRDEAIASLSVFGTQGQTLAALANYVVDRQH